MNFRILIGLLMLLASSATSAERKLVWYPDTSLHVTGRLTYDHVRVIDDRRVKSIGFLRTGAFNRNAELEMEDSVGKSIEAAAMHMLKGAETSPGEFLIVLRDLRIEDRDGGEEIGTVHLRADLFTGSAGSYTHLKNYDTLYETKSGWDVTQSVQQMASEAIVHLLLQAKDTAPAKPDTRYSLEEAVAREHAFRQSFPVYQNIVPTCGLYRTVNDFLQLQAADTNIIRARYADNNVPMREVFYHRDRRGKRGKPVQADECFAAYDGKNWFIARAGGFSLLKKEESGDFYTILRMKGLTDNSVMIGIMFGAIGAAIASADHSKHYTLYRARMMPDAMKFAPVARAR